MRHRTVLALGLVATMPLAASLAGADEGYRHGRLRYVEPGTILQRATETEAEEAMQNLPFLPGDRIWTDAAGRAEFQFPDGTTVRLDRRGKLDYAGHEEDRGERIVLRLWSGSVVVHAPAQPSLRFEIETPAGFVEALERSVVRVDLDGGDTRVSAYEGEAVFDGVRLSLGQRSQARWGERPGEPEGFDRFEADDLLQWDQDREADARRGGSSARYLPDDLGEYAGEFEGNGDWRYNGEVSGYVWFPHVEVGWQPYSNGHWAWTPYGWTWVPSENWGWAPSHYGRWGYGASMGWYWVPGRTWGPAWVSWAVGGGYAAWCPLGWRDHPVTQWGHGGGVYGRSDSGHAVTRGFFGRPMDAWNVVRQGELGRRGDVRRYRVDPVRVDPGALRVADSPLLRPTRDGAALRPSDAAPGLVRTRMTPGTFVRELSVDNKTTIPAPWTRGYGPPPAGVEGARYGTPKSTGSSDPQESRTPTGAMPRGGASAQGDGRAPEAGGVTSSPRSAPRPAPFYAPGAESASGNGGNARPALGGAERRAPAGQGDASGERPRRDDTYRYGGAAPRGDSSATPREGGSAYRPGGQAESRGGAGRREPSDAPPTVFGGGSRPQGDGSGARPRNEGGTLGGGNRPESQGNGGFGGGQLRHESGSSGGGSADRSETRGGGGTPRPTPSGSGGGGLGGGAPRPAPSGGGGAAHPSGGGGHGGGNDHAVPRGRPNGK
jgi:hypothetical protein